MPLTDLERELLDFAGTWWKYAGAQDQEIRDRFGLSATNYWQKVNALLDRPEALAYAPVTVKRLKRLRAERQAARSVRRLLDCSTDVSGLPIAASTIATTQPAHVQLVRSATRSTAFRFVILRT
jgi:hypothetical protein